MGLIQVNLHETKRESEQRWQETFWMAQQLRATLCDRGWQPPHSFKLRDPDETNPHRQVLRCWFRPGVLTIPWSKLKLLPKAEQLHLHRECGYFYDFENKEPGDDTKPTFGAVDRLLFTAVRANFLQIEKIGRTFFGIGFVLTAPSRGGLPQPSEQRSEELTLLYSIYSPGHFGTPFKPIPLDQPLPNKWFICCQEPWRHLALLLTNELGQMVREIQWEDDPYLINIAEQYMLLLLYREQPGKEHTGPEDRQNRRELASWGPEHFPSAGTLYLCPPWLARIIEQGYY